jgi:hypothetical protein
MSMGTPDTGDNNPLAAGRIARIAVILLVLVMAMWVLGRMAGLLPSLSGLVNIIGNRGVTGGAGGSGGGSGAPGGGAVGQLQVEARQLFIDNGGPTTTAQAHAAVTTLMLMQQKIDALSEAERAAARALRDRLASELLKSRMTAYLSAPPAKRRVELDRQIRQDELMRRAWKTSRSTANAAAAGEGFPGGGGGGASDGGAGSSEDDRNRQMKDILDHTSPEQRALYNEYRRAMEARRQQMGLPP